MHKDGPVKIRGLEFREERLSAEAAVYWVTQNTAKLLTINSKSDASYLKQSVNEKGR